MSEIEPNGARPVAGRTRLAALSPPPTPPVLLPARGEPLSPAPPPRSRASAR